MNHRNIRHKDYLVDVMPLPLRDSTEWTTHFYIHHDTKDAIELIDKVQMGNRCVSEDEAIRAGIDEACRRLNVH